MSNEFNLKKPSIMFADDCQLDFRQVLFEFNSIDLFAL